MQSPNQNPNSARPPTILLADDEAHITCVVAQKLRSAGFEVVTARDGEEAYELACQFLPALVITDLQMPRMSGLDLALKLRETESTAEMPVMMLTARGYIIAPSEAARTNIRHIMGKPFSAREVVRRVVEILGEPNGASKHTPLPPARAEAA